MPSDVGDFIQAFNATHQPSQTVAETFMLDEVLGIDPAGPLTSLGSLAH
jgi:hypothetical protein